MGYCSTRVSNVHQMAVSCEETGYYCYFEQFYLLLGESWELSISIVPRILGYAFLRLGFLGYLYFCHAKWFVRVKYRTKVFEPTQTSNIHEPNLSYLL